MFKFNKYVSLFVGIFTLTLFILIINHFYNLNYLINKFILSNIQKANAQTPVVEAGILAGTGQATRTLAEVNAGDSTAQGLTVEAMTAEAAARAHIAYGTDTPKVLLVTNNIVKVSNASKVKEALENEFGFGIPIYGVTTGKGSYMPITIEDYPDHATDPFMRSIAIVALGGNQITRVEEVKTDGYIEPWHGGDATTRITAGQLLAAQLHPDPIEKNLILVMNSMHGNSVIDVINGMKQVLGTPLPDNIRLIGWGGLDGAAYFNGNYYPLPSGPDPKTESIVAVMITGTFDWAFSGFAHSSSWPDANVVTDVQREFNAVVTELGSIPDVTFLTPGHPSVSMRPAFLDAVRGVIGQNGKLFGWEAASETGHDTTTSDGFGSTYHMYVVGLKGTTSSVPTPTTTSVPGDTNNDQQVDNIDVNNIITNFNSPTFIQGDFNNSGVVNILDLSILYNNFAVI